jgi:Ca2+-binding RTX toxin-like protein
MRWKKFLLIFAAVGLGVAVAAAGAHGGHLKKDGVKAKIQKHVLTVTGSNNDDSITLGLAPGDSGTLQIDTGDHVLRFNRDQFVAIVVDARDGNDTVKIDETGGVFTDTVPTTLNGGDGDDTLQGGSGNETLDGGHGDDLIDGNRGADVALMGAGDDTFKWDPGDGSDTVDGQDGTDTMVFNGANAAERIELSANGNRLRFTRDVANITMDTDGVESVLFNALGGADVVTVNDLSATDVKNVSVDLGTPGDGVADRVLVNGTANPDNVQVATAGNVTRLTGLAATVAVVNPEPADVLAFDGGDGADAMTVQGTDGADTMAITAASPFVAVTGGAAGTVQSAAESLFVDGLAGNDTINAGTGLAGLTALTIDGGADNDTINGGDGNDRLVGGDGNDFIDGNRGADVAFLGAGDDTFQWDPGDGSDTIEGQDGTDTMLFNGANVAEKVELSANGPRLRFTRDVANITMDADGIESVVFNALGGADVTTVDDLSGTDVTNVKVDLGAADGAADRVTVNGTNGADVIVAAGSAGSAIVSGLAARVTVAGAEVPADVLAVNALGGDDVVQGSSLAADAISFAADGGPGDDVLTGGAGADVLTGGAGDDVLIGGAGADVLDGGPGNNVVIQ